MNGLNFWSELPVSNWNYWDFYLNWTANFSLYISVIWSQTDDMYTVNGVWLNASNNVASCCVSHRISRIIHWIWTCIWLLIRWQFWRNMNTKGINFVSSFVLKTPNVSVNYSRCIVKRKIEKWVREGVHDNKSIKIGQRRWVMHKGNQRTWILSDFKSRSSMWWCCCNCGFERSPFSD